MNTNRKEFTIFTTDNSALSVVKVQEFIQKNCKCTNTYTQIPMVVVQTTTNSVVVSYDSDILSHLCIGDLYQSLDMMTNEELPNNWDIA
jgi:hypothetical protein